jgi:ribose/xylose/arabinose/galactoside ABC-type transport system permease subunit
MMLLLVLRYILNLLGFGSFYRMVMTGVVIHGAAWLDGFADRRRGRA